MEKKKNQAEAPKKEAPAETQAKAPKKEAPAETQAKAPKKEAPAETQAKAPKKEAPAETQTKAQAKKEENAQTVLERTAQAAIRRHGLKEVHLTTDGVAFRTLNAARNHAATLKDKTIKTFKP